MQLLIFYFDIFIGQNMSGWLLTTSLEGLMNALEDEQEFEVENIADLNKMFENYRMNEENLEENRTDAMSEVFHL